MINFKLDDLYNVEAEVELPNGDTVVVRTLTDAELNQRELASLEVASAVEADLQDKDGKRYKELIGPLQQFDRNGASAIIMTITDITTRIAVEKEIPFRYVDWPDDATEEEKRAAIRKQEERDALTSKQRSEEVSRRLTNIQERLDKMDEDELRLRATAAIVESEIFNRKYDEFMCQTVYMATRVGDSKGIPRFDLEVVRKHGKNDGVSQKVFDTIIDAYAKLDTVDPWELKKKS